MNNKICQCCHVPLEDGAGAYCEDCAVMTGLTRQITAIVVNEFNPVFRRKLAAVLMKDRDAFVSALLRG